MASHVERLGKASVVAPLVDLLLKGDLESGGPPQSALPPTLMFCKTVASHSVKGIFGPKSCRILIQKPLYRLD